jgi:hypothetical protein
MGYTEIGKIKEVQQNDDRYQDVIFHPVFFDPAADHDANIGNKGRGKKEQEMNVKQGFKRLFGLGNFFFPEQQEIGKGKEGCQVQQITHLEENRGLLSPFMKTEWSEN